MYSRNVNEWSYLPQTVMLLWKTSETITVTFSSDYHLSCQWTSVVEFYRPSFPWIVDAYFLGVKTSIWHPSQFFFLVFTLSHVQSCRCEQDSNLRGETPLDFKSNALTTRPSQLMKYPGAKKTIVSDTLIITATLQSFERYRRFILKACFAHMQEAGRIFTILKFKMMYQLI